MRQEILNRFYVVLNQVRRQQGGFRYLSELVPLEFQAPGVYFFLERRPIGIDDRDFRVIRVGKSNVDKRLKFHQGNLINNTGNHRVSIFRNHIGRALINQRRLTQQYPHWGNRGRKFSQVELLNEIPMEQLVSNYIRLLPYIYIPIEDVLLQELIEIRSVEILSNRNQRHPIDVPDTNWLGYSHPRAQVSESHLWNIHYVDGYQARNPARYHGLLDCLENLEE